MDVVKIYKDKITVGIYDDVLKKWVDINIKKLENKFSYYFTKTVEINSDVTVEDFMNHLSDYKELIDLCFLGHTHGFKLDIYLKDMKKTISSDLISDLKCFEFYWYSEIYEDYIETYSGVHGISNDINDFNYSLSLQSISEWKNLPIVLNEEIIFGEYVEDKYTTYIKGKKNWILYDVISALLSDITFYGDSEDKESIISEMDDVKDSIEECETYTQEEAELIFLETELDNFIKEEDYEKAEEVRKKIEKLK